MLITLSDDYFMQEALKEADAAYASKEVPIGAVIVSGSRIIARAHNQVERLQDVTAHAEILALTAAFNYIGGKYLSSCTLYVTLEPCCMCAGAMQWAKLGKLVFGADDPKKGYTKLGKQILHPRTQITRGVLMEEAKQRMAHFFQHIRT